MQPLLRNILVVIGGIILGSIVNMAIITVGPSIIPLPEGVELTDMEALRIAVPNFEAKHYLFPFLAHALGTLVGAWFAVRFAASRPILLATIIGVWFLIGGILNAIMLGTPIVPSLIDFIFAYIPMALIGAWLAAGSTRFRKRAQPEDGAAR